MLFKAKRDPTTLTKAQQLKLDLARQKERDAQNQQEEIKAPDWVSAS